MLNKIKFTLLGIFLTILPSILYAEIKSPIFKQILCSVNFGNNNAQRLFLEIADNEQKRSYGLMNREDMKSNSGMLFIWKDRQIRNFWMKNTHFNLDLFFLNNQGEIIEIYKNAKAFFPKTLNYISAFFYVNQIISKIVLKEINVKNVYGIGWPRVDLFQKNYSKIYFTWCSI